MDTDRTDRADGIRVVCSAPRTEVVFTGEHDLATRSQVRLALARAAQAGVEVVVDLSDATFFDAALLGELARCRGELVARGGALSVRTASPRASGLFDIAGLAVLVAR